MQPFFSNQILIKTIALGIGAYHFRAKECLSKHTPISIMSSKHIHILCLLMKWNAFQW